MRIFAILIVICTVDVTVSVEYTCDRRAPCGCSKRPTIVLSKIIGGELVNVSQAWAWMASLRRDDLHQCGASLVTPMHVITAAHCVKDIIIFSRLSLNFGITNLSYIGVLRNVTRVYVHPNYDEGSFENDLAILRLDKPLNLMNSNLSTICLPSGTDIDLSKSEYPPPGVDLIAIGWGAVESFVLIPTPILRQVTLQSISRDDPSCQNSINNDTVQFCAGVLDGEKDTCRGDSGGPLMLFKNRRWQLVGITSYGKMCGAPGLPGIYTRLAFYDEYVKETIRLDVASESQGKQMNSDASLHSSTRRQHRQFLIEFFPLGLFFILKKLFDQK